MATSTPTQRAQHILQQLQPQVTASSNPTSNLKYTTSNQTISVEDRHFYEKNGYLLVKNLVPMPDLDTYREHFVSVANGDTERAFGMTVMRDIALAKQRDVKGEQFITKVQDFNADEVFFSYNAHPAITPYVSDIIGSDLRAMHTMLINKPPDLGMGSSRHPPHQDLWYFPFRPAEKVVCSWTAMQKINRQNGCLFVVPGTHVGELLKHGYPNDGVVNKAYHGIHGLTEKDTETMVHVEMEPGDTLFFHPLLIHGSGRNNSGGYRKAISCHYANSTACEYIDVTGSMQEELADEIMAMMEKRTGQSAKEIRYADLWRMKSRQVLGDEGKLA